MPHDHLKICRICGMTMEDYRDCECINSPYGYGICGECSREKDYERTERKRNAVY